MDISAYLAGLRNSFSPDRFRPLHLRYLQYLPEQDSFRLLIDKGDAYPASLRGATPSKARGSDEAISEETKTLLQYFFIGLSLPNDSFWVNLRPDSPDNIIDPLLAQTDVGKILLEADLQLKKDTAKYTSPDTPEGRDYWDKLYQKAGELFGSENITIPTLTRPWIVPDEIIIREAEDNAYIYKATLKVMLEEDYLTQVEGTAVGANEPSPLQAQYQFKDPRLKQLNTYSSQLIRELIIPKLTQEINTSRRYAPLRQVYYSLILAQWFKTRFGLSSLRTADRTSPPSLRGADSSSSLRSREAAEAISNLIDSRNLTNLTSKEPYSKDTYFNAYKQNFQQGEYNLKESRYTPYGQVIRTYFSGGINIIAEPTGIISGYGPIEDIRPYIAVVGANGRSPLQNLEFTVVPVGTGHRPVHRSEDSDSIPTEFPNDRAAIFGATRDLANADARYHKAPDDRGKKLSSSPNEPVLFPTEPVLSSVGGRNVLSEPTIESYVANIMRDIAAGSIFCGVTADRKHSYAHMVIDKITSAVKVCYLKQSNTRPLLDNAEKILRSQLRARAKTDPLRVLVIGAGAGREVSDISVIAEEEGRDIIIDTCGSLDPIASRFRLIASDKQIKQWIYEFILNHPNEDLAGLSQYLDSASGEAGKEEARKNISRSSWIPFELAMALQKRDESFKIFELLPRPFIRRQYIGEFPDASIAIEDRYDLVYDHFGGLYYTKDKKRAIDQLATLLNDDGICYMGDMGKVAVSPPNLLDTGLIRVVDVAYDGIFIKTNSRYAAAVSDFLKTVGISNEWISSDCLNDLIDVLAQEIETTSRSLAPAPSLVQPPASSPAAEDKPIEQIFAEIEATIPEIKDWSKIRFPIGPETILDRDPQQIEIVRSGKPLEFTSGLLYHGRDGLDDAILCNKISGGIPLTRVAHQWATYDFNNASESPAVFVINSAVFNKLRDSRQAVLKIDGITIRGDFDPYPRITTPLSLDSVEEVWIDMDTYERYKSIILNPQTDLEKSLRPKIEHLFKLGKLKVIPYLRHAVINDLFAAIKNAGENIGKYMITRDFFSQMPMLRFKDETQPPPTALASLPSEGPFAQPPASSPASPDAQNGGSKPGKGPSTTGGIDLRKLPAVNQAISNLGPGDMPLAQLNRINLDDERREIERLVNAGIMPSSERVKECALAVLSRGGRDKNKVTSCVMDILRLQEERYCQTDPVFKDILIVLESPRGA